MHEPWTAPRATAPLDAEVTLPGSKSMTARALVLAALANSPSVVRRPLRARDTDLMAAGLRALGTEITDDGPDWLVAPGPLRGPARVDVGLAGTVMRFLPPVAGLATGAVRFDGDARARERPLGPLLDGLAQIGVKAAAPVGASLPLTVSGAGRVAGGTATLDASSSSQFVSALLLAAARFDRGIELRHVGPPVPSAPHVMMTVDMVRQRGVEVDHSATDVWRVMPGAIRGLDTNIEPDLSSAAPFLAAALVAGGQVTVVGWPVSTAQPGDALRDLLTAMGATVVHDGTGLTVRAGSALHGLDADLREVSELMPVLAALAALADSPSRLRGLAHVRGHETDRLAALARELSRLGADVRESDDGLDIRPRPLSAGVVRTYDDHRIAMAAAVLGLAVDGLRVENVATTAKTLPDFVDRWSAMLGRAP